MKQAILQLNSEMFFEKAELEKKKKYGKGVNIRFAFARWRKLFAASP